MKKVILILIDSLMPNNLESAITSDSTPALKYLIDNGIYNNQCPTVFPTMTASIDASLMTGTFPNQHRIPGLIWYNSEENRIIDYVNGTKTTLKLGINSTIKDVFYNLNEIHLSKRVKTIFEELDDNNKTSASISFIIHRGRQKHQTDLSLLLNLVTKFSLRNVKISGPNFLCKGALCKPKIRFRKLKKGFNQTIFKRYGVNDSFSTEVAEIIITSGSQPDLMMIYLPDHDHYLHRNIDNPLPNLEKVDEKIARILNTFGSWKEALKQNIFIIIGDHGQTRIGKGSKYNIDLDKMLNRYKILKVGKKTNEKDEVVIANNERMAYVYPLKRQLEKSVLKDLLKDDRIDFVAWKHGKKVIVEDYQKRKLAFGKNGKYVDPYGVNWNIEGNFDLLDLRIEINNKIKYFLYPDSLSRLYGALFSHDDYFFVVSAKPTYEFISKTFPKHLGGGSHGSLHRTDSLVPLIVSGAEIEPKTNLRVVDIKEYLLQLLNVNSATTGK